MISQNNFYPREYKGLLLLKLMMIVIGSKSFSTLKKAEDHVRELLYQIGFCESMKTTAPQAYEYLLEVVKRHPCSESILLDAVDICIGRNAMNRSAIELSMVKADGAKQVFSWRNCVAGRTNTPRTELLSACRYAVSDQITDFRARNICTSCEFCKKEYVPYVTVFHVDHINFFHEIVDNFFKESGYAVPAKYDIADNQLRKFKDPALEGAFQHYHEKHARLRYLCADCNTRRPKKS